MNTATPTFSQLHILHNVAVTTICHSV